MKWLGLPLMLFLAFASPATLAASCADQPLSADTSCACCSGPDHCCLDSSASSPAPLKTSYVPAPEISGLTGPTQVAVVDWFVPAAAQRVQRSQPPAIQVRPPPDPARLCTFLI